MPHLDALKTKCTQELNQFAKEIKEVREAKEKADPKDPDSQKNSLMGRTHKALATFIKESERLQQSIQEALLQVTQEREVNALRHILKQTRELLTSPIEKFEENRTKYLELAQKVEEFPANRSLWQKIGSCMKAVATGFGVVVGLAALGGLAFFGGAFGAAAAGSILLGVFKLAKDSSDSPKKPTAESNADNNTPNPVKDLKQAITSFREGMEKLKVAEEQDPQPPAPK